MQGILQRINRNNMKQTALEWLVEQICGDHTSEWQEQIKQAKAMEEEQIIQTYSYGWHDGQEVIIKRIVYINKGGDDAGKEYYKQTFKSE